MRSYSTYRKNKNVQASKDRKERQIAELMYSTQAKEEDKEAMNRYVKFQYLLSLSKSIQRFYRKQFGN